MSSRPKIAVILDIWNPYQRKIVRGISAYVDEATDWSLHVEEDPLDKMPDMPSWGGQGIVTTFTQRRYAEAVRDLHIPVVGVEGGYCWYEPESEIPYFSTDNGALAYMAAEHLLSNGYRRLAYCGIPKNRYSLWSEQRAEAMGVFARQAGVPYASYVGRQMTSRNWTRMQAGLCKWLSSLEKPVGLLAANDARARHVLEACRTIKARVPDDIAVLGVANDELMCELTDPPLSSVEQGAYSIGYQAALLLDRLMRGGRHTRIANLVGPERVVVRQSTNYLAIEDPDVATALRYIREHAHKHIRVPDVLEQVMVSRSTLEARFRKLLGRSIHEEIQTTIFHKAQDLIAAGGLTLKQIAFQAGFSHVQHMNKIFKERTGRTPGEFRSGMDQA